MGGGGMSGMKRRGGLRGFEDMDPRPRSAPEMQMGGYPGMGGMQWVCLGVQEWGVWKL